MGRVLVTEKIAQSGLDLLADAGHEVDVRQGLTPEELLEAIAGAHALIIRSATQVTAEVLAAGTDLVVVGRAGIGLDNVDVTAATERGVMVVNAPTVEHPLGRRAGHGPAAGPGPQHPPGPRRAGGRELGALEVGGRRAARQDPRRGGPRPGRLPGRPAGPGLRHAAGRPTTPSCPPTGPGTWASSSWSLEELMAESDFVSVHLPKNPETLGLIGTDLLAKAKPGIRIVNTARGGIVDEEALAEAIRDGTGPGGRPRRVRQGADHRVAPLRAALGRRLPRTSAPRPRRPRTRPASPSPSR